MLVILPNDKGSGNHPDHTGFTWTFNRRSPPVGCLKSTEQVSLCVQFSCMLADLSGTASVRFLRQTKP